jgi:hypothetical protein
MRKHPLIALTAFTALTASAIAGASTGTFASNSVLTSARTVHRPSETAAREEAKVVLFDTNNTNKSHPPPLSQLRRPQQVAVSSERHLQVVKKPRKLKPKPRIVVAAPPPVAPVAPAPVAPVPPPVVTTTTLPPAAPSGGVWYQLRICESSGNYAANTGNGYYGAYQFSLSTWWGLGFTGFPSAAPPAVQDRAAAELQARSGWGSWPSCAAELGL